MTIGFYHTVKTGRNLELRKPQNSLHVLYRIRMAISAIQTTDFCGDLEDNTKQLSKSAGSGAAAGGMHCTVGVWCMHGTDAVK